MSSTGSISNSPRLRLDTSNININTDVAGTPRISIELTTPTSPGFSHTTPVLHDSSSLQSHKLPASISGSSNPDPSQNTHRARNESRKLLAHLLLQLQERPMPPSVFDAFKDSTTATDDKGLGSVVDTVRGVVKLKGGKREPRMQPSQREGSDDDDGDSGNRKLFSTDVTLDLMLQLKDVLVISIAQGWQIFYDSSAQEIDDDRHSAGKSSTSFRLRRQSLQPTGRRSRSSSPAPGSHVQAPELLSQCITIISSIVSEDCRFQVSSPRPSRPPNALQAVILDVAQFLVHAHRHDPKIVSRIGFALIPAFATFQVEIHTRLLVFFEEAIMRGVLEGLGYAQGTSELAHPPLQKLGAPEITEPNIPIVSIQVDEAQDDAVPETENNLCWTPWSSHVSSNSLALYSTNAPLQQLPVYYLASLTPPLLAAILESVDFTSPSLPTSHRFCRLLKMIVDLKPDAYLDVLEVVAYHTAKARRAAISILTTFWPRALGHVVVGKPLPVFSYADSLRLTEFSGTKLHQGGDHPYAHQFVPWRFVSASRTTSSDGVAHHDCRLCSTSIQGFGLLCPFCMCAVHFDCYDYPEGCFSYQCAMASDRNLRKVVLDRFCYILPARRDLDNDLVKKEQHAFRLVNLFTLSLCFICRMPLWGCAMQGLKCISCKQSVHSSCLSGASSSDLPRCRITKIDSSYLTIEWAQLRQSFADHYRDVFLSQEDLDKRTYEEVSVFFSVLWTQLQIMNHGVALGTITINQKNPISPGAETRVDEFELQYLVGLYEHYLSSGRLSVSLAIDEYLQENRLRASDHSIFFDWSTLVYIATAIKSPYDPSKSFNSSPDFLNVTQPDALAPEPSHPYELTSLSRIRDALGYEFHVLSDPAARFFLCHMHHIGFFDRLDRDPRLFHGTAFSAHQEQAYCIFPIPLGLDLSTDVETLVTAVETCLLSELDLTINEVGFLLLVRKLWPNGMASNYASRRLTRSVLSWIYSEDDSLAMILRDYLAQGRSLPGVRGGLELLAWPSSQTSRPAPASSVNNGGDYVASRRSLLNKYGARWLLALHDQEETLYAEMVYELSTELAEDEHANDDVFVRSHSQESKKARTIAHADKVLRFVIKLCQNSVAFSVFDTIFLKWLESISDLNLFEETIPSLFRLFNRETESAHRFSSIIDATLAPADIIGSAVMDPWRVITSVASTGREGVSRSLRWLCLFARSGVDIPVSTYMRFTSLATQYEVSLVDSALLVKAAFSSTWLKSMGRQELQRMFSILHTRLAPHILESFHSKTDRSLDAFTFLRRSLATCLLLYGCERNALLSIGMITEDEIKDLPSRRKLTARASMVADPITIDAGLMKVLESYIGADVDEVSCLIGQFLNMFISESPLLESYEVDNFILRNGNMLCACAWELYDIQRHEISNTRSSFLLRILVVDSQPFQTILQSLFQKGGSWEMRFLAVNRLFRIILDVTSPSFAVEDRQWRSSVADIFFHYFSAIWMDDREEIRLAVDTWSQTLLPAHQESISLCWNETLAKAPIPERVKLVSFLIQLRPHFPNWKVLSWEAIVETLLEDDYLRRNGANEDGPASAHLSMYGLSSNDVSIQDLVTDPDLALLLVSTVSLSLQMIADGITIDTYSLLMIKEHLLKIVGFEDVSVIPSPNGQALHVEFSRLGTLSELAFPCIADLLPVLDAFYPFDLAQSAMRDPAQGEDTDTVSTVLIGTIFVDISLALFNDTQDLLSLPVLVVKNMLESLIVIIYKHDFESRPLKHLFSHLRKAVKRAMGLFLQDINYEIRQLALSITQAFVKRWTGVPSPFTCECIEYAAKLVTLLEHNGEDILVAQARSLIGTTLTTFSSHGILLLLCRRDLDREFFTVIKHITDANAKAALISTQSLRDALLRDAFLKAVDNEFNTFQLVVNNLHTYIEVVHHQQYSADLMQVVGSYLNEIASKSSELTADEFDPNPLLLILSILIQHNKAHSREMLGRADIVLRVALIRFHVNAESLSRFLRVTSTLYRKNHTNNDSMTLNKTDENIFDILGSGLRMRARVSSLTLTSLLEVVTSTDFFNSPSPPKIFTTLFLDLADAGFHFLQNHSWSDTRSENDFTASVAVAKMVLRVIEYDPGLFERRVADATSEKSIKQGLGVRAWNILLIAALTADSATWAAVLFAQFASFSASYFLLLRPYVQSSASPPESATADINHAYAAIKLWLLVASRTHTPAIGLGEERTYSGDNTTHVVWNELWPPFQCLVYIFEKDALAGHVPALATSTWSSVADLFIFVRQTRSPIALETASQIAILKRLQIYSRAESRNNKLTRTLQLMSLPPSETPTDVILAQLSKDIVAAEKLQVLDARRRDLGKTLPERSRRDLRIPT